MEIEKNLVVSTANITKDDSELLTKIQQDISNGFLIIYQNEYCYSVYLNKEDTSSLLVKAGFSDAFVKLYKFAQGIGDLTFLKIDCDGTPLEGFETFDW